MSASWSLGDGPTFAPAVLCRNLVATCTHNRRLWIWIWMGNFISTASLVVPPAVICDVITRYIRCRRGCVKMLT